MFECAHYYFFIIKPEKILAESSQRDDNDAQRIPETRLTDLECRKRCQQ